MTERERVANSLLLQPHLLGHLCGKTKLTPLHDTWIRWVWDSNEPRALQACRGAYKSTSIAVVGTMRWLLFHPNDRIAIVRKTFTDASDVVDTIRHSFEFPAVQTVTKLMLGQFAKTTMARDGRLRFNFKKTSTPEVSVTAHGLDGSLTGKHYDKILCDDIITLRDRISRAERERVARNIYELATNIIDPGKGSGWIGTPWHREDGWQIINSFAPLLKFPLAQCPGIFTDEEIEAKRRTTTPFLFNVNYELCLAGDEATLFQDPWYGHWDYTVKKGVVAHLDAAFGGGDYCAFTIMTPINGPPGGLTTQYQGAGFTYHGNVKDWVPFIVQKCKDYKVTEVFNELNPDKGGTADKLRYQGIKVRNYTENMNKGVKIATYGYDVWKRVRWSDECDDEYMRQILDYHEGLAPDDAPDSFASLMREAFKPVTQATINLYTL